MWKRKRTTRYGAPGEMSPHLLLLDLERASVAKGSLGLFPGERGACGRAAPAPAPGVFTCVRMQA